ncbi:hypothetical protein VIBNISFn118_1950001 [Vibrio nigripulchritudo SFn118]|nr:hypothetical protein [Vibrio nigripulchritudo]CCN70243.1 hypothetical protein VIBNISFn118_1950001 [Vibrio nigripulchritudo SFn118]
MGIVRIGTNNLQVIVGTKTEQIAHEMKPIPKTGTLTEVVT